VLYWTRSSIREFGVSINVWRLAGDTLNITCNFLYCNHQLHREFLISLYINCPRLEILFGLITFKPRYNITIFIAHTTLWTENLSFTLSRFTAANSSEKKNEYFELTVYRISRWWLSWCYPEDLQEWLYCSPGCLQNHWKRAAGCTKGDHLPTERTRNMWNASSGWNFLIVTDGNFINWYRH